METAYLHLVTNHIPIIGVPFALFLLLMGLWRRSNDLKAAGFLIFALLGPVTLTVYLLGQGGEDFVEDLAGVSHDSIEDHEDIAKFALGSTLILAGLALFALIRYKGITLLRPRFSTTTASADEEKTVPSTFPTWITLVVLAAALVSSGILGYTGRLGGMIRHTEFHGPNASGDEERNDDDRRRGRGRR